jgi:hypothetical protein
MKGLCQNKKKRAVSKQPICGLWAIAKCCGIKLKNQNDVEAFRQKCLAHGLVSRTANWVGGTTAEERHKICAHFNYDMQPVFTDLLHKKGPHTTITVHTLLKNRLFFTTQQQYILEVDKHVVYVKTNRTKRKLWVADQRAKIMRLVQSKTRRPDADILPLLAQHVVSVMAVSPHRASME